MCECIYFFSYRTIHVYARNSADPPIFAEILGFNTVNELFVPATI